MLWYGKEKASKTYSDWSPQTDLPSNATTTMKTEADTLCLCGFLRRRESPGNARSLNVEQLCWSSGQHGRLPEDPDILLGGMVAGSDEGGKTEL
jgi:hypothetical protein